MNLKFHIVLVRPIYPSNIGFCARAAANMGAASLSVISNEAQHMLHEAKQRAAGAQESLSSLMHYKDWDDFYSRSGEGLRIAFTRRAGKIRETPLWNNIVKELPNPQMLEDNISDIYMFFGQEDDGLSAEDLHNMHLHAQLPVYGDMASFNLGHAVLLAAYILQDNLKAELKLTKNIDAPSDALIYTDTSIKQWLECLGMDNSHPTKSAAVAIHKMILRAVPTRRELEIWEKVSQSTIRLLKSLKPEDRWQRNKTD